MHFTDPQVYNLQCQHESLGPGDLKEFGINKFFQSHLRGAQAKWQPGPRSLSSPSPPNPPSGEKSSPMPMALALVKNFPLEGEIIFQKKEAKALVDTRCTQSCQKLKVCWRCCLCRLEIQHCFSCQLLHFLGAHGPPSPFLQQGFTKV